ncbi:MAG: flagellar hook-basal body complex protein [Legionella sp.]|jgi:flagellar hook protein FlgE
MNSAYYTSLSGMLAANYGLQNTSNNVANLQSPGFKRSDVFYSSLGTGDEKTGLGAGVRIGGSSTDFSPGKYIETDNPADLAIVGQGFFIVRLKSGELLYTRDGEFAFNTDGLLIDKHSGGLVQGYDTSGNLVPIKQQGPEKSAGKPTHELYVQGQFVRIKKSDSEIEGQIGPEKSVYQNIKFDVQKIYDKQGKAHTITMEFESIPVLMNGTTPLGDDKSWRLVAITCDDADIDASTDQKIVFANVDSGSETENSTIKFILNNNQELSINFGSFNEGADKSVQLVDALGHPEGTAISTLQNDGYGSGTQIDFAFDENGQIAYIYDNGQTIEGLYLGLARFDDMEHSLKTSKDSLFALKSGGKAYIGRANSEGFGSIKSKNLEESNINPTNEFANLVVLQRMFQACSQILDIDKQLLESLEAQI